MIRHRGDRGAAAVEMALLLPILVVIIGGVADIGDVLRVRVQLQEAVQEGANFAAQNPGSPAAIRARVMEATADLTPDSVTVACSGTSPTVVTVRATKAHKWIMGLTPFGPLNMTVAVSADVLSSASCVSG